MAADAQQRFTKLPCKRSYVFKQIERFTIFLHGVEQSGEFTRIATRLRSSKKRGIYSMICRQKSFIQKAKT